jgi:hypothetical protein
MPVPDFSPGEVLTAAAMDSIGLWLVKTVTVGSGVSTIPVTSCFSADFANYRVVMSNVDASVDENSYYLTLSGSTSTTYRSAIKWVAFGTGTVGGAQNNNSNAGFFMGLSSVDNNTDFVADITSPFLAQRTGIMSQSTTNNYMVYGGGIDTNAASSTGFTIVPSAAFTFTGGTIRVYGYRN